MCVKVKNPLEFADLFSTLFFSALSLDWWPLLALVFQAGCWAGDALRTLTPCQLRGVGLGTAWWALQTWTKQEGGVIWDLLTGYLHQHTFWGGWNPLPGLGDRSRSCCQVTLSPVCILPTSATTARQCHHYQWGCHLNTERRQDTTVHPREPRGCPGGVGWSDCQCEVRHLLPAWHWLLLHFLHPVTAWWSLSHGSVGHRNAGLAWAFPSSKQVAVPLYSPLIICRRLFTSAPNPPLSAATLLSMAIVVAAEVKLWKWGINCLRALIIFSGTEIICQTQEPF